MQKMGIDIKSKERTALNCFGGLFSLHFEFIALQVDKMTELIG